MKGRKPIYQPETLKIGQKMDLKRATKKFGHQYARQFNKRFPDRSFKFIDGSIQRVA